VHASCRRAARPDHRHPPVAAAIDDPSLYINRDDWLEFNRHGWLERPRTSRCRWLERLNFPLAIFSYHLDEFLWSASALAAENSSRISQGSGAEPQSRPIASSRTQKQEKLPRPLLGMVTDIPAAPREVLPPSRRKGSSSAARMTCPTPTCTHFARLVLRQIFPVLDPVWPSTPASVPAPFQQSLTWRCAPTPSHADQLARLCQVPRGAAPGWPCPPYRGHGSRRRNVIRLHLATCSPALVSLRGHCLPRHPLQRIL